ncbi:MAG: hypothetical protein IPO98_07170 [Saprospiraceae bacterium]|nr:hypothetical protein [Saprospiraceae bacterium]
MKNILCFYLLLISFNAYNQKLTLVNIEEKRSITGGWDYCTVELKPIGDEVRNFTYYKINEVKSATDSKGLNLMPENPEEYSYTYIPVTENLKINLQKASRSAATMAVNGSVSFIKPTEANGGIIKISGFRGKPEINLSPKGVAFAMYYYDKASLTKKSKVDLEKRMAEVEKLPESEQNFAYEINSLVNGMSYYSEEDLNKTLFFAFNGDNSNILGLEFEDAKGKKIAPVSTSITNKVHTYYFNDEILPSTKVILNMVSAKAVKIVPFVLVGLDLP